MIVGVCEVELFIYEANSLKEKRHVIKSIIERIKFRFNVSIAEVDLNDLWQRSIIGFSCVTNNSKQANSIVNNVIKFILEDGRVEIINQNIEIY